MNLTVRHVGAQFVDEAVRAVNHLAHRRIPELWYYAP